MQEIETVAKVFLVEERMIDLTYNPELEKNIIEPSRELKKFKNTHHSYSVHLPALTIKGFN